MNVRSRLEKLEEFRPENMSPREMSNADLEAIVRAWIGHDPTDAELESLAATEGTTCVQR